MKKSFACELNSTQNEEVGTRFRKRRCPNDLDNNLVAFKRADTSRYQILTISQTVSTPRCTGAFDRQRMQLGREFTWHRRLRNLC